MSFKVGDKVEFRDIAGWQCGTVTQVSDMHGEYLIRHNDNEFWISAHRVRRGSDGRE